LTLNILNISDPVRKKHSCLEKRLKLYTDLLWSLNINNLDLHLKIHTKYIFKNCYKPNNLLPYLEWSLKYNFHLKDNSLYYRFYKFDRYYILDIRPLAVKLVGKDSMKYSNTNSEKFHIFYMFLLNHRTLDIYPLFKQKIRILNYPQKILNFFLDHSEFHKKYTLEKYNLYSLKSEPSFDTIK
jgi:hypothetical protein